MRQMHPVKQDIKKTVTVFINILPIIVGMLLATSLVVTLFPGKITDGLFVNGNILDATLGAAVGSIAAGHPMASYLLGGELLANGVGLIAVTALLVSWVTVGIVQLPAETLMLGTRFAIYRNMISFFVAIVIAFVTVSTLKLLGAA